MKNGARLLPEDEQVRGNAYLCQTGPCVSCGGCCGLYNISGLTREHLHALLAERTDAFAAVPRNIDAILAFETQRQQREGTNYPAADFHHCVFTGLIRDGGERVGCLLHPLALGNGGIDWRGLSYYGGAACKHFFCPTYDLLETRWKRLVREVLADWYEYGLIIPEHRFLEAAFGFLEARLGTELDAGMLDGTQQDAVRELLRLRLGWPYRGEDMPLGWNFFSTKDTGRPALPGLPEQTAPLLRTMLEELDTRPDHAAEALARIGEALEGCIRVLAK